jgi:hypothetical protein
MNGDAARTALEAAHDVAAAVGEDAVAAYAVGSVALGAFVPEESDLDVVAVVELPLSRAQKEALVERVRAVDVSPARGLELVVWALGREAFELNLNTGPGMTEHVAYGPEGEPFHWFPLAQSMAEQAAIPLAGPPWAEVFPPVARNEVLAALVASLEWHEQHEPGSANAVRNACRAWYWVETGRWTSKPAAASWLVERVRAVVVEATA